MSELLPADDLVSRLRSRRWEDRQHRQLRGAAATHIESLTARLTALEAEHALDQAALGMANETIAGLRERVTGLIQDWRTASETASNLCRENNNLQAAPALTMQAPPKCHTHVNNHPNCPLCNPDKTVPELNQATQPPKPARIITPVFMLCDAYESGFRHGFDGRDLPNPYKPGGEEFEAYQIGYDSGYSRSKQQAVLRAPAEQAQAALKVGDRVELNFCDSSRVIHIRKVEIIYRLNADGFDMEAPYSSDELRAVPTKPAEQAQAVRKICTCGHADCGYDDYFDRRAATKESST